MILMFGMFSFPLKETKKKKNQYKEMQMQCLLMQVYYSTVWGRGERRKQKIQSVCKGTILTNVTKHTRFPEENPFLVIAKPDFRLPQ